MLELSSSGSVRGVPSNGHPYRDPGPTAAGRVVPWRQALLPRCRHLRMARGGQSPTIPTQITDHVEFEPAFAIKFTIYRGVPSGSPGDADIFGSQQYGPLLDVEVPDG